MIKVDKNPKLIFKNFKNKIELKSILTTHYANA